MARRVNLGPGRPWTSGCDLTLRQLAAEGYSAAEIAEILNRSAEDVGRRLADLDDDVPERPYASAEELAWRRTGEVAAGRA